MAINGNEVKFYSADLSQSGIIESSVESGSIVYSTTDKALYLIDGENGQIGRTAHLISNIIESSSQPDLSSLSNHSPEKALYKYNNHLHYYNNSTLYQLVNAGELTEVSDRVTTLEESTFLTSDDLDSILNNKNYITNDVLERKNYVTVGALNEAGYVDTDALNNAIENFITAEALTDYAKTEDLSDFVSTNDLSIYAKTADIENTYAKTAALDSYLTKLEAEKQYLTQNDVDGVYATVESVETVSSGVGNLNTAIGNHTKSINEINTKINDIQSSAGTVGGLVDNHTAVINNLKTFTGYSNDNELKAENFKSLDARLDTLEANYTTLDGNVSGKLNASGGTSTNLTESTQLVVGTKGDTRLELSKSSIKKYTSSTDKTGTPVLFKGDVSVSKNGNSYIINDGTNSITINIPSDLVVSSGIIETNPTDQHTGTYLVLTLNDAKKDKIYIDVKDLANDYTAISESTNPVQLTLDSSTHEFKAVLTDNSVTSDYLANDIKLSTLIVPSIKGSDATTPAAIAINGGTIDSTGAIAQAVNLTNGKSISISGDISGTISNVGTANSSGELTLPAVNTSANATTKIVTITPTMADTSKDDLKINIPNFVANQKGLITSAGTTSVSIGAVNTVKKSEDTNTTASKPIAFMAGANNTNDTLSYNSGVTITPKDKKITATTFSGDLNGNADTATKLKTGIQVSLSGAVDGGTQTAWDGSGNISVTTVGPGRIDNATSKPGSVTTKGQETGITSANTTTSFNIPNITMNTDGMVSNISDVSVNLTLNNVAQTVNTGSAALPILIADSTSGGTAGTKYASGVTITPNINKITATTFSGALNGNADTATAFSADQTVSISGGATGTSDASTAGWTVPITLNSKLTVGAGKTATANSSSATANNKTYLNLWAPNASGTNTVLSSLQLKGSGATTVSAINGAITINSTDYTSAISDAQAAAAKTVYNQAIPAPTANEASETIYPLLAREGIQILMGDETISTGTTKSYSLIDAYLTHQGYLHANKVYGSVWNDYAEYRQTHHKVRPGQCVYEKGDGSLAISYERMMPGANIVSDTFGFAIGETDECKTPLAVSGRVLAYPYESKETYNPGDAVCSGPNGTISKMTRAEIRDYPERIVGTVSEIPTYEVWGSGNIKVNGRIWIKVR